MMTAQQSKLICTNPKAMMDFHLNGRLPTMRASKDTPLRQLIKQIPVRHWACFKGINVNPALGFNGNLRFHTLYQLMNWLGNDKLQIPVNRRLPYESFIIHNFRRPITVWDLIDNCSDYPSVDFLRNGAGIPRHLLKETKK